MYDNIHMNIYIIILCILNIILSSYNMTKYVTVLTLSYYIMEYYLLSLVCYYKYVYI